jgi:GH24 family phage-related lysozyme (muramidase)
MEAAAAYISQGPTTGAKTGKYYSGLSKRREFEAKLFLN